MQLQLLGLCILTIISTGESVKMVQLNIPGVVDPRQEKVMLRCEYELSPGETLYQVRWYKDGNEFFRYAPTFNPPGEDFNVTGVRVSRVDSNDTVVVLLQHTNIQMNTETEVGIGGTYACEVMEDRPSFDTKYDMGNLTIAVLPQQNPALGGLRSHYQLGDVLEAECTSAPSYPTAELTFYLKDIQVTKALTRQLPDSGRIDGKVVSSTRLELSLPLQREYFNASGSLSLTCRSILPGVPGAPYRDTKAVVSLRANNEKLAQEAPADSSSDVSVLVNSLFILTVVSVVLCSRHLMF
ncbi:uncharacterized protein [Fopius arisanus]|uniref:Cadm2_0 protein n=1 Tax=Fopius arisanus TaxID=64838 RepID=A0A0C9RX48_9HYME|nr:PREDICTED: uncharacterized protein LOC105262909 [Fopius arisanus]